MNRGETPLLQQTTRANRDETSLLQQTTRMVDCF
jgi:hypothetical protein